MSITEESKPKVEPALKLNFLSHGTLDSRDLAFSRKFYEEFLGFEVVQTSPISLLIRLGGPGWVRLQRIVGAGSVISTSAAQLPDERGAVSRRCHPLAVKGSGRKGLTTTRSPSGSRSSSKDRNSWR